MANLNTEPIQVGDKIRLATWNCGGLSFTQMELCNINLYQFGHCLLTMANDIATRRLSTVWWMAKNNDDFILSSHVVL